MSSNFAAHGIYILHGEADDNVPVSEARTMAEHLTDFHHDWILHEQPGAGHWWDSSDEPGAGCVDWEPMFDFLARHALPPAGAVRNVRFTTVNPAVSAVAHWVTIESQVHSMAPSTIDVRFDPGKRRFVGTTDNVSRVTFDLSHTEPSKPITVRLDGQELFDIPWPKHGPSIHLALTGDPASVVGSRWSMVDELPPSHKGPHRSGPFKQVFQNRFMLVYGTQGTPEENGWALAKARYDAETFWYRGNGSLDVVTDQAFDPAATVNRNVILYGNADTNGAGSILLSDSPIQVTRGTMRIAGRTLSAPDLGCLFIRPRPDSDSVLVGAVTGTGIVGMKLTDRLPYFVSGIAYPDLFVVEPAILADGIDGVRVAGFFGLDWSVESGEFAWNDSPTIATP